MQWNQCQDTFQFLCKFAKLQKFNSETNVVSKWVILSEIAKLFDPLESVIVIAKLILQDL